MRAPTSRARAQGMVTDVDVRHYMLQLLQALDFTHSKGIMHRDVKVGRPSGDGSLCASCAASSCGARQWHLGGAGRRARPHPWAPRCRGAARATPARAALTSPVPLAPHRSRPTC